MPLEAADERGQLRGGVGTDLEVRGKLGRLRVAVDDVERVGVDDEEIGEAEDRDGAGELLVEPGVDLTVFPGVAGRSFEKVLLTVGGRVGGEVVVLEGAGRRRGGEILLDNRLTAAPLVELRQVVGGVERGQRLFLGGREPGVGEFREGRRELPRRPGHCLAVRHRDHLIAEGVEHHRDIERFGRSDRRQPFAERRIEGRTARFVADPGDRADRRQTHSEEEENDLRLDAHSAEDSHDLLAQARVRGMWIHANVGRPVCHSTDLDGQKRE